MRVFIVIAVLFTCTLAPAAVVEKSVRIAKTTVHYKIVLPEPYDATKAYPAVLAFSGGYQTMATVDSAISRNWREQAERRGYIIVIPAAPSEQVFFMEGARVFPEFLTHFLAEYRVQDNKLHIAGVSNGGISAFHIAASHPQYFRSVTGYPGYLQNATPARLKAISKMCISMYAGELDEDWVRVMQQQSDWFRGLGFKVHFSIEKAQPHRIETLAGEGAARLFDFFEGCTK